MTQREGDADFWAPTLAYVKIVRVVHPLEGRNKMHYPASSKRKTSSHYCFTFSLHKSSTIPRHDCLTTAKKMLAFVLYTILLNSSPSLAFTSPVEHSLGSGPSLLRARSSPANSNASLDHSTEQLQGWTSPPDGRGTIDIITSCFLTISLCAWTMLCLNVSPFGTSRIARFLHKAMIFCEAVLGPEFIFQTSLGQWASARRSVSSFAASGLQGWTMKHGFFADMGGYVLDPPDFPPFPLNAKQLHYLVTRGYIDYAVVAITPDTIDDKNKSDEMARIITMIQVLWFVIDTIARAVQNLAISTLELSTIAYVWCSVGTSFFWRYKPQGINMPVVIVPKQTMAKILVNAGPGAAATYISTPMDFVGREKHHWGLYWAHWFNILYHMGWNMHTKKRPVDKISDDQFLPLSASSNSILVFFQASTL